MQEEAPTSLFCTYFTHTTASRATINVTNTSHVEYVIAADSSLVLCMILLFDVIAEYPQDCMSGAPVASGSETCVPDDIQLVTDTDRRPLRSAAVRTCFVPRTHNSFGDRSFMAAGPSVWNSLPPHLRQDMNFARFHHKLKTFLFWC